MSKKYTISLTFDQLSALDDAVYFVQMARDGLSPYDQRVWSEVVGKVKRVYDRATREQEELGECDGCGAGLFDGVVHRCDVLGTDVVAEREERLNRISEVYPEAAAEAREVLNYREGIAGGSK